MHVMTSMNGLHVDGGQQLSTVGAYSTFLYS